VLKSFNFVERITGSDCLC